MEDKAKQVNLGKNIRKIRKRQKLTLLEVEVRTGIDTGDLSRIERGLVNLTFLKLVKLAETLQVTLNDLYQVTNTDINS